MQISNDILWVAREHAAHNRRSLRDEIEAVLRDHYALIDNGKKKGK